MTGGTPGNRAIRLATAAALLFVSSFAPAFAVEWPAGTRAVVSISFDVDGETLWWRDKNAQQGPAGPMSQGVYGPTVALPKILDLLERHGVRASFFVPTWIAETYPDAVRSIVEAGHELGAHGVYHVPPTELTAEEERRRLRKSVDVLSQFTGSPPAGYRAPAWALSDMTLELVGEAGFAYSSNLMDDDLPYIHDSPAGLVELPVSWVLDDAPHFWFDESSWDKTIRSASEVEALWREEFTAAWQSGGFFNLTMHPQFIGRPARLAMLDRLLTWIREHDGVRVATCAEVAERVRATAGE